MDLLCEIKLPGGEQVYMSHGEAHTDFSNTGMIVCARFQSKRSSETLKLACERASLSRSEVAIHEYEVNFPACQCEVRDTSTSTKF